MTVVLSKEALEEAKKDAYALASGRPTQTISSRLWLLTLSVGGILITVFAFGEWTVGHRASGIGILIPVLALAGCVLATWIFVTRWVWRSSAAERVKTEGDRLTVVAAHLETLSSDSKKLAAVIQTQESQSRPSRPD